MSKNLVALAIMLAFFGTGCSQDYLQERHEHDDVVCVYRIERNFWGVETAEKEVACK